MPVLDPGVTRRSARGWLSLSGSGLVLASVGLACSSPRPPALPPPVPPSSSDPALDTPPSLIVPAIIPRFFELGPDVEVAPGQSADTTVWIRSLLERASDDALGARRDGPAAPRFFLYAEPDPATREVKRYALELPRQRSFSANDRVAAYWSDAAVAFDFGVGASESFGNLSQAAGAAGAQRLLASFEPSQGGAQAYELLYAVEGSELRLLEHKGLVPGLPVAFERFTLYRADAGPFGEPSPIARGERPIALRIGLTPGAGASWARVQSLELPGYRVLLARDAAGDIYFLAAESALAARSYAGGAAASLLAPLEAFASELPEPGPERQAVALLVPEATRGTLFTGKLERPVPGAAPPTLAEAAADVQRYLGRAAGFLSEHDAALADLRQRGPRAQGFINHFIRTLLATHGSRKGGRLLTELPYADAAVAGGSPRAASIRFGSDQASVLIGLAQALAQGADAALLEPLARIAEASLEALAPSGAVYESRFDGMALGTDEDLRSGRADAYLSNGAVAVGFNHLRLVVGQGARRDPGATWGAFGMQLAGRIERVDAGAYRFAIDPASLPEHVRSDQAQLSVTRRFTRSDGRLSVHETAAVARGVPALRVSERVENTGPQPLWLGDLRLAVGDFFHYGDGALEISQSRYGMSPVLEGAPLHVGVWIEGQREPLWGDAFAPGWVDVSAAYRAHAARFIAVYGYDRAQLYFIPEPADEVWLYNAASGAGKDGYEGWTTLELRYRVDQALPAGASRESAPVYSYSLRAPLFSADADAIPDELQSLVPLWTKRLEAAASAWPAASAASAATAMSHSSAAPPEAELPELSLVPDSASVALHLGWAMTADRLRDAARLSPVPARGVLEARARRLRAAALRGAAYDLTVLTHLRNRSDLMPTYGAGRNYGYHVPLFDWAYRESHDPRYRDALITIADRIATPDKQGGLQITDPSKPNYGGYWQNEVVGARGNNRLDDQGIKLWALRVAFAMTRDPRYRASAALAIEQHLKLRDTDHLFYAMSKSFDRYVVTGAAEERTPLGHYAVMAGLAAWSDLLPLAREKYALGLANATSCHPVHAIGTTGVLAGVYPDERLIHFDTSAELGGMFLLALSLHGDRRAER